MVATWHQSPIAVGAPMLPDQHKELIHGWLGPALDKVEMFDYVLEHVIRYPQIATRIGKASKWDLVSESYRIATQVT